MSQSEFRFSRLAITNLEDAQNNLRSLSEETGREIHRRASLLVGQLVRVLKTGHKYNLSGRAEEFDFAVRNNL